MVFVLFAGLLVLAGGAASAQTTTLQFSFSNPGARSMGLGGAFIGLADDATTAYANPAGLMQLVRPEVSIEGRSWSYDTAFTAGGRASGPPTGVGIDTSTGLEFGVSSNSERDLSFLSLVYPFRRWSLALYRHQEASFATSFATEGLFAGPSAEATVRFPDSLSSARIDGVGYGLSVAYRVSETLSFGLGLSYVVADTEIVEETFLPNDESREALFAPASYAPARSVGTRELIADDADWTLRAGFLWRLSRSVSLGGVYRQGSGFETDAIARAGPAFDPAVPPGATLRFETLLRTPDVFGVGIAARARGDTLTLTFDWVRVEYSDLLSGLDPELFTDQPVVDDVDEVHAGIEYVLLKTTPLLALRGGVWLDPDHGLRAPAGRTDPFERALFRGGDDEIHFAAGLGLAFRIFQLDLGVDFSDSVDTASISAIYQF